MNIQEAKEEIVRTVRAYTAKDERGVYRIPAVKQRPVLLMGPPGIGKTAIMEQAAEECGVGLLAYTITHHTRQSAVGLPQLAERTYGGKKYTVTEYTMSEIVGSVHEYMERTGHREGILFIDEINCVSETLAPTMLQFLQYKTFGNHPVPGGWIIVAAGNPPEFNKSVRELDMAALDRVRMLDVRADFSVWKDYAFNRGVHPAILSYLEMKQEHFYQVTETREKREFVTARGWEDLSVLLLEYERQGFLTDRYFMEEFIRNPKIAADFTAYYQLYGACAGSCRIPELLAGTLPVEEQKALLSRLRGAGRDMRCIFVRHMLAFVSEHMTDLGNSQRYVKRKREVLEQFLSNMEESGHIKSAESFLQQRTRTLEIRKEHQLLKEWEEAEELRIDRELRELLPELARNERIAGTAGFSAEEIMSGQEKELGQKKLQIQEFLGRATDFLLEAFGKEMELTEWFQSLRSHGDFAICGFERPEAAELCDRRRLELELQKQMKEMEELYETDHRI